MNSAECIAALLKMAAEKSTRTPLGWAHPDVEVLSEAARLIAGQPKAQPVDGAELS